MDAWGAALRDDDRSPTVLRREREHDVPAHPRRSSTIPTRHASRREERDDRTAPARPRAAARRERGRGDQAACVLRAARRLGALIGEDDPAAVQAARGECAGRGQFRPGLHERGGARLGGHGLGALRDSAGPVPRVHVQPGERALERERRVPCYVGRWVEMGCTY